MSFLKAVFGLQFHRLFRQSFRTLSWPLRLITVRFKLFCSLNFKIDHHAWKSIMIKEFCRVLVLIFLVFLMKIFIYYLCNKQVIVRLWKLSYNSQVSEKPHGLEFLHTRQRAYPFLYNIFLTLPPFHSHTHTPTAIHIRCQEYNDSSIRCL